MKVLIDMNLSHTWVRHLSEAGHEARHWSEVGKAAAEDSEIVEWARAHDFVIMTNDLDFPRILAMSREGRPSVILLRGQPILPVIRGEVLRQALSQCREELEAGAIVTLDWRESFRVRSLPIG